MDTSSITKLQRDLLFKIVTQLKAENAKAGSSLIESSLAQQFEVSRTPMRAVLNHLSEQGVTKSVPYKGFVLQVDAIDIELAAQDNQVQERQEKLYLRLLMDLFFGDLGDSFSENELQQRYDASRGEVQSVLRLLESDAIFRRSPGYKWQVDGVLNTLERHTESYRCRLIFEPAGLLEPTWQLKHAELEACRESHIQAIKKPESVSASQLFTLSATFHEVLASSSGNRFLLGMMQQQNRMRKATDLVSMHIQSSVIRSCQRRLDIMNLVFEGDNQGASEKLAQLLDNDIRVMNRTYQQVMNISQEQREQLVASISE